MKGTIAIYPYSQQIFFLNSYILFFSWICFRVQAQEKVADFTKNSLSAKASATDWCADADDWNDENANNEENGNVLKNACSKLSDEDDESLSLDDNINFFSNLSVNDNHNVNKGDIGKSNWALINLYISINM